MNVENIKKLMEAMRLHAMPKLGFNMGSYFDEWPEHDASGHECETTACGAGWAVAIFDGLIALDNMAKMGSGEMNRCFLRGKELLGLDDTQAHELFLDKVSRRVTPEHFLFACQSLIDTGKVIWPDIPDEDELPDF